MMRLILCVGDEPETGGRIEPSPVPPFKFYGHPATYIGAHAYCFACRSVGVIAKTGGPRRMKHLGHEIALDGDTLLCKCPRHPRMIAAMQSNARHDDMAETMGVVTPGETGANNWMVGGSRFDEQFTLRDQTSHKPLSGVAYRIRAASGATFTGVTDDSGRTQRVKVQGPEKLVLEIQE
ncbi:PAAR domain-containing protein [Paraburkholderia sp. MPAMCS5]|uniref:PAAR domain-containing protein n=1 Tax=Paraburkholderia sp. MPAMCS5 TaxID=3112563 RepID=UPI002E18C4BF|nr:PAAR domain-containing protein [Paraburkholderia sp. MPAMCS5]